MSLSWFIASSSPIMDLNVTTPDMYEIWTEILHIWGCLMFHFPPQWSSLDVLDTFPSLVELKFKSNPLLQGKESTHYLWMLQYVLLLICSLFWFSTAGEPAFTARQLVIARIRHLTFLNNSPVSTWWTFFQHTFCLVYLVVYLSTPACLVISPLCKLLFS